MQPASAPPNPTPPAAPAESSSPPERTGLPPAATSPSRRYALLGLLLCLLGVGVAAELTRIHLFVHTDPSYHSLCAVSEGINCETVATSPYSVFLGLPVSVWGLLGYLLMGALAGWALVPRRLHPRWPFGLLLLLVVFSVGTSVVLAYVSATRIASLCLFCLGSYGINALLLLLLLVFLKRTKSSPVDLVQTDLRALRLRPGLTGGLLLRGGGMLVLLQVLVPAYWQTPGWTDLARLPTGTDEHGHHWIGAAKPRLTIVEFSDYECPHCRAAHKAVRTLAAQYPEQLRLVHRHLPLDQACHPKLKRPFHEQACRFAEAAECAARQGKFWEMNDALFSSQDKVRARDLDPLDLAVRLGLDRSEFKTCLTEHQTADRVQGDLQEALARKLTGTPSFVVGERLFLGRIPADQLAALLRDAR